MKILFFTHYFPPEVNAPASRTYEHCVRWVNQGHPVTVVTCNPNCPDGVLFSGYRNSLRPAFEDHNGIRVVRVWSYLAPNAGTLKRIANYLSYAVSSLLTSLTLPRPDLILSTSPQFFCGWAGLLAAKMRWLPSVVEIRDIWPESIEAVGAMKNRGLIRVLEILEKWLYRWPDALVAVGKGYQERILEKVDVRDRITVIMNGVDLSLFKPIDPPTPFLEQWDLQNKFVCSYVGTLGMAHGLEIAIKAAQILRDQNRSDIVFLLVGDGAERQNLQRLAAEHGVSHLVRFTGRQPKESMPLFLGASSACLVHLKGCELFESVIPSKIFEMMAMKKPIIMGVRGESRELVNQAGAGVDLEPDNADELARIVLHLADHPEVTRKLGNSAREYVTNHFNRDKIALTYLEYLRGVVARSRGKSNLEATSSR